MYKPHHLRIMETIPTAGEVDIGIIKYYFSTYLYRM